MDPRVDVSNTALAQQLEMERRVDHLITVSYDFYQQAVRFRAALPEAAKEFDQKALKIQGVEATGGGGGAGAGKPKPTFALLNRELGQLATTIEGADAAPTPAMETAYEDYCRDLVTTATSWNDLMRTDLASLNDQLRKQQIPAISGLLVTIPAACK
jgi:DNA replication initiation complex subunit (GINS family)